MFQLSKSENVKAILEELKKKKKSDSRRAQRQRELENQIEYLKISN